MGNEEKVGALILVLLLFSMAVSLIPVRLKYKYGAGIVELPLPWTAERRSFSGTLPYSSVTLMVDVGRVDVTEDPSVSEPAILLKGATPAIEDSVGRLVAGTAVLNLPRGWNGTLRVNVGFGGVMLREAHVKSLEIDVGMGSVEGTVTVDGKARIKTDKGNVRLVIKVPKDARVHVKVRSLEGSVHYDGQRLEGGSIERTLGQGERVVDVEVNSYSVQLDITTQG